MQSVISRCQLIGLISKSQRDCVISTYRVRANALRSKLTGDALAEAKLSPEQRADIQARLVSLGLLADKPDGEFGPNTRVAIKKFQQAHGFQEAPFLTSQQRALLLASPQPSQSQGSLQASATAQSQSQIFPTAPNVALSNGATVSQPSTTAQNSTPSVSARHAQGEFARLMSVPNACEVARQLGRSQLWTEVPFANKRTPGPTCEAASNCLGSLNTQIAAAIDYLTKNPAVFDMLRTQLQASNQRPNYIFDVVESNLRRQQFELSKSLTVSCSLVWSLLSNWFDLSGRSNQTYYQTFIAAGQSVLANVRAAYDADNA
jgi:hypothetical protein